MLKYISVLLPVLIAMLIYFARLEGRLSQIITDISWIKKELANCRPRLGKGSL